MPRQRDYHAEYERRMELREERGLTMGQARGHPEADEVPVSTINQLRDSYAHGEIDRNMVLDIVRALSDSGVSVNTQTVSEILGSP